MDSDLPDRVSKRGVCVEGFAWHVRGSHNSLTTKEAVSARYSISLSQTSYLLSVFLCGNEEEVEASKPDDIECASDEEWQL